MSRKQQRLEETKKEPLLDPPEQHCPASTLSLDFKPQRKSVLVALCHGVCGTLFLAAPGEPIQGPYQTEVSVASVLG